MGVSSPWGARALACVVVFSLLWSPRFATADSRPTTLSAAVDVTGEAPETADADCGSWLYRLATFKLWKTKVPSQITWTVLKGLFFPVYAIGATAHWVWQGAPNISPATLLRRESIAFALYATLLFGTQRVAITHAEVQAHIGDPPTRGRVVLVNGFKTDDPLYQVAEHRFRHRLTGDKHLLHVRDYGDLLAQIDAMAAADGPIDYIELHGHGVPGMLVLNGQPASGPSVRTMQRRQDTMLVATNGPASRWFAKDARIAIYACEAACGESGEDLLSAIAEGLLQEHGAGGRIGAPTVPMHSTLAFPVLRSLEGHAPELRHLENPVDAALLGTHVVKVFTGIEGWQDLPRPQWSRVRERTFSDPRADANP